MNNVVANIGKNTNSKKKKKKKIVNNHQKKESFFIDPTDSREIENILSKLADNVVTDNIRG